MAKKADYLPDVLYLLAAGATVRDAAVSLGLSPSTVRRWLAEAGESLDQLREAYRLLIDSRRARGDGHPAQCRMCGYWVLDDLRVHRCPPLEERKNWWYRNEPIGGVQDRLRPHSCSPADTSGHDQAP